MVCPPSDTVGRIARFRQRVGARAEPGKHPFRPHKLSNGEFVHESVHETWTSWGELLEDVEGEIEGNTVKARVS
jgi:hypothetical protein